MKTTVHVLLIAACCAGVALTAACSSSSTSPSSPPDDAPDAGVLAEEETPDSGADASPADEESGLTGKCADAFGDKLTEGFGRIDGTVYAVQKPSDTQCTMPNDDHVVVQVLMNGAVYRLVTNVLSNGADPNVRFAVIPHALPAPAFAEGWHAEAGLDYPTTLEAHNDDFAPFPMDELVSKVAAELTVGAKVSIYAESGKGRPESAHKIHRTSATNQDGAIVVDPTGAPKFLLFHFDGQAF